MVAFHTGRAHSSIPKNLYFLGMEHFGKVARDRGYELPEELVQKGWSKWESLVPHNSDASMDMEVL